MIEHDNLYPAPDYDEGKPLTEAERKDWMGLRWHALQFLKEQGFSEQLKTGLFEEMSITEPQRARKILESDVPLNALLKWIFNI